MSRIFEAIKKERVVGFHELFREQDKLSEPGDSRDQYEGEVAAALSSFPESIPFKRLRISASSPLFPFDDAHRVAADQ
jgi:hypothetical protein